MSSFNKSVIFMKEDLTKKGAIWSEIIKQRLRKKREGALYANHADDYTQGKDSPALQDMEEKIRSLQAKEAGNHTGEDHPAPRHSTKQTSHHSAQQGDGYADYSDEESVSAFRKALKDYDEEK